jgi:hypothetical protein
MQERPTTGEEGGATPGPSFLSPTSGLLLRAPFWRSLEVLEPQKLHSSASSCSLATRDSAWSLLCAPG